MFLPFRSVQWKPFHGKHLHLPHEGTLEKEEHVGRPHGLQSGHPLGSPSLFIFYFIFRSLFIVCVECIGILRGINSHISSSRQNSENGSCRSKENQRFPFFTISRCFQPSSFVSITTFSATLSEGYLEISSAMALFVTVICFAV